MAPQSAKIILEPDSIDELPDETAPANVFERDNQQEVPSFAYHWSPEDDWFQAEEQSLKTP